MFGEDKGELENTEYWQVLNVANDGIMGYLSIPKIDVKNAIYHGTGDKVLQTGIGHLNGTKLPIGGESTHSVLAAHRGLPTARLFTDIDQLKKGDMFYIHVLDEVLAYQVDQILDMVDKDDHETLEGALQIEEGKDQVKGDMFYIHVLDEVLAYQVDQILDMVDKDDHETLEGALQIEEGKDQVTLFTCTPYGVNSHRLLVRGTRVPYNGEEEVETSVAETMLKTIQNYYMIYLILGLSITFLVILFMRFLFKRKDRKRK